MSKFEYMDFTGGSGGDEFVAHAGKFSKQQTIDACISEWDYKFEPDGYMRKPGENDVYLRWVKYYVRVPDWCGHDNDGGGCYTYCNSHDRGAFPVWVIESGMLAFDVKEARHD